MISPSTWMFDIIKRLSICTFDSMLGGEFRRKCRNKWNHCSTSATFPRRSACRELWPGHPLDPANIRVFYVSRCNYWESRWHSSHVLVYCRPCTHGDLLKSYWLISPFRLCHVGLATGVITCWNYNRPTTASKTTETTGHTKILGTSNCSQVKLEIYYLYLSPFRSMLSF